MPQWLTSFLASSLPSLLVGVLTALISVRLSLRRFHAERWWERKADAYSRIIEALHNAMEYCHARSVEDLVGVELTEEKSEQLDSDYRKASVELKQATGIGAYIISMETSAVLTRLQARKRPDPSQLARFEFFETEHAAYKEALDRIRTLAKKDLKV